MSLSKRPTKAGLWLFGAPTSTKKKLCGNFLTPLFYAKADKDLTSTDQQIVKSTINDLIVKQKLPDTATNLIFTTPRTSCIYFLPKNHKPNSRGRLIVSACNCATKLISSYLNNTLALFVISTRTLNFSRFQFPGRKEKLIFTMYIISLYTVISNSEGPSSPQRHFFIYALLRNQAWKHDSAWLN